MPSHQEPIKVLYIAGAGRSGGTFIGQILGQHPDLLYAGELRELFTANLLVDRLCGCSTKLIECAFWREVFNFAYGGLDRVDTAWLNTMRLQLTRTRNAPVTAMQRTIHWHPESKLRYAAKVAQVYHSLLEVSQRHVIVDASRSSSYAHILETQPQLKLYVLHLVRDPRAVAFSWSRGRPEKIIARAIPLRRLNPVQAAADWVVQNTTTSLTWERQSNYLRVRYEDFITQPLDHLHRILAWLGEPATPLDFINDQSAHLDVCHSAAGNIYRLKTGWVPLTLDDEWKQAMHPRQRAVVNMITFPWCLKYGYPMRMPKR